jgi:hypothetical protein
LHNSLLLWQQNILVFDEEWVRRLLDFPTTGVVERNVWFPILQFHGQLHQYVYLEIRPIHGMRINYLGICVSYREMAEFL